jgi:membrane-associated phospholipid phosphatase
MNHISFRKALMFLLVILTTVILLNGDMSRFTVFAQSAESTPIEPDAALWQTWVLESASQFRSDAPPDETQTAIEIGQLLEMVADRDDAALQQIAYWNSGPATYRWNQIALNALLERAAGSNMALRNLALLQVAIYDATVAAWDSKYTYNRPRPSEVEPELVTVIPNPSNPSYPSEYAVTAGAAATILAWLFPEDAQYFEDMAQEAVNSRLLAGVEFPSDTQAGLELGRQVAELVIARGQADGSDAEWTGSVPTEAGSWTGENPGSPTAGTWQTWVLTSPDQFRPDAPPAYDSEELAVQMAELREFERAPITNAAATFWEFGAGGRRIYWFWNDVASRLILASPSRDNAPLAARAYALVNIAGYDSMVACWDAKYTYWMIRPFQLDPEFTPLFTTPNHPSYPSAHSCMSSGMAGVLAHLFPTDAEEVRLLASEASESRIWGGIHYRIDVEAGTEIGENIATAVIEREP